MYPHLNENQDFISYDIERPVYQMSALVLKRRKHHRDASCLLLFTFRILICQYGSIQRRTQKFLMVQFDIVKNKRNNSVSILNTRMAAIPAEKLGDYIDTAKKHRTEIISAVDLLFTGF